MVDDQVFNIEALKIILRVSSIDINSQVEQAFDGIQAVEKVKERNSSNMFDIIFMDCQMPFKDGPTAAAEIREYIEELIEQQRKASEKVTYR